MMSKDLTPSPEEKENSPFRSGDAPAVDVSGIPEGYVTIDLSSKPSESPEMKEEASAKSENLSAPQNDTPTESTSDGITPVTMEIIGIRFKKNGKIYYFDPHGIRGTKGEYAIVETARGQEYGEIALENTRVPESEIVPPIRPVIRIATKDDHAHFLENRKKEKEAFSICLEKIAAHKLDMKLVEAQYTFDNGKLLFYFTSAGRVDFRDLVKDLASVFRTRIELRQIGIRDEAKLIGGLGSCGRALCCSGFLSDFGQVSIKMAKEQNLSLNSTKISGTCGRLMCCLRYEYETYLEEIRLTPPVDSTVKTPDGIGTVTEIAPLLGTVKVRLNADPEASPQTYHRDSVTVCPHGKVPTEEEPRRAAKSSDDFAEKLAALEKKDDDFELSPRRTPAEQSSQKPSAVPPTFRKKDDNHYSQRPPKKNADSGMRNKPPQDDESKNRSHPSQSKGKAQNHQRKHHGTKTQHRGSGNKGS